jgi:predicted RNA-binding protein with PIN domain
VDGFNVLHAHLLEGRDRRNWRSEARRRLVVEQAERLAARGEHVCVVFDGRPAEGEPVPQTGAAVRVVFAPDADAWILAEVGAAAEPGAIAVVSSDREVKDGARLRGARVVSPSAWLARCAAADSDA